MKKTVLLNIGEVYKMLLSGYENVIHINEKLLSSSNIKSLHLKFDDEEISCFIIAIKMPDSFYESNFEEALHLETNALTELKKYFSQRGVPIILLSSCEVFDGESSEKYTEEDEANPVTEHGRIKLASEKFILEESQTSIVFRLPWLYSVYHEDNFVFQIINAFVDKKTVNVFEDQHGNLLNVFDLDKILTDITFKISSPVLMAQIAAQENKIYHISPKGFLSKFEISIEIFKMLIRFFETFVKTKTITPISAEKTSLNKKFQKNCCLSSHKFLSVFRIQMPDWHFSLFNAGQKIIKKICNIPADK